MAENPQTTAAPTPVWAQGVFSDRDGSEAPQEGTTPDSEGRASSFTAPTLSLPKGGGAIRGIDEKFKANPATGTGSVSVPLALTPGRSGFGPQLSLDYDSSAGNGIFGMGWTLSLPSITRRTDKGIPQYLDSLAYLDSDREDIFVLSGVEDLVPVLVSDDGETCYDEFERDGYRVKRYRPRIEGLFGRIERWTRLDSGEQHWRSISRENILNVYGFDPGSRIADPENPEHVFSWLLCRSYDDKGNAIVYDYAAENDRGVDLNEGNERSRGRTANRYPKRIRYGNRQPLLLDPDTPGFRRSHLEPGDLEEAQWMFEVLFDYSEGHYREDGPDEEQRVFSHLSPEARRDWLVRKDPFSTYRSGFEIRTYRLCHRVLMIHHFPEELGTPSCLVRSTGFRYRQKEIGSLLDRVVQSGYRRLKDGRYLTRSLPPLDLFYTVSPLEGPAFDDYHVDEVDGESLVNLPGGIDGSDYRWLDLDGEGVSGVLTEQDSSWFYKPNLGKGRFGAVETITTRPSLASLNGGRQRLMDVAGDGSLDLVDLSPDVAGFYERTFDAGWAAFRTFRSLPVTDWNEPNLRFVDLTGDGIPDVLITEGDEITWHASLLQEGFGPAMRVPVPWEEKRGPRVIFADGTDSVYLADMSGDGLSDLVRIRNGEVCYWPNRGYGRFGAKVTMDRSPWFDEPDLFDQKRIRLADTDGSGTTDVLYFSSDGLKIYLNETGNGWSEARHLRWFPSVDNVASITVTDFLGRGTACVLWSSPLPTYSERQLRYIDLMCGQKPHLLNRTVNNLGAETRIDYASSTKFYLADKAAGTPWVTRLPFPVHVVERVEVHDRISRNRFVTRYTYHHGFYDGVEHEFRGFGRVDQIDTEEIAVLTSGSHFPASDNIDAASAVPPVLTRTWFHTGVYPEGGRVSRHLAHEYYREGLARNGEAPFSPDETRAMTLEDTILPAHLTPEEAREACRSLKGSMLRQEIYARDGTEESCRPYLVTESNLTIRLLQKRDRNRHAVFFTHAREQVGFHYERKLYTVGGCRRADPRVSHGVTLEVDDFGNVVKSVAVGYGRRFPDRSSLLKEQDRERQARILLTVTENDYTNAVEEPDAYRTPLPSEQRLYELVKAVPTSHFPLVTNLFRVQELSHEVAQASDGHHDLPFADWRATGAVQHGPYRRLLKQSRTLYRDNRLQDLLPLGAMQSLALPGESYRLALTHGLISEVFRRGEQHENLLPHRGEVLRHEAGYADLDGDGNWWIRSGRVFYSGEEIGSTAYELEYALRHFFLPHRYRDAFGNITKVGFDAHDLAPVETIDAVGNTTRAECDYRVLAPRLLTDPNGDRSEVAFDAVGRVAGTAVKGKLGEPVGDSLTGFEPDLSTTRLQAFLADPHGQALQQLQQATTRIVYDVEHYFHSEKPVFAATIERETHVSDLRPGERTKVLLDFGYSDGFGRQVQRKLQAEPGPLTEGGPVSEPRWIGSGWTIYNNKGKPVRKYEPFFSASFDFEFNAIHGVSPVLFYDPIERVIATLHPDHTYDKVTVDPWQKITWDVNDTVVSDPRTDPEVSEYFARLPANDYLPTWYRERIDGRRGPAEQTAAEKAAKHARTPTTAYFDTLGRIFLSFADNGLADHGDTDPAKHEASRHRKYLTRTLLDVEGNQRAVIDAQERVVIRYDFDMLGAQLLQTSMDAGERWMLKDVAGKPVRAWDSRLYAFRTEYDALRRPIRSFVQGGDPYERAARTYPREILFERTIYGDSADTGLTENRRREANLRGNTYRHFDMAGVVTTDRYDFKGNLLQSCRQFANDYKSVPDWSQDPALEAEKFVRRSAYDALNRVVRVTNPDRSVYRPTYNKTNLLEKIDVVLRRAERDGQPVWTPFVTNIVYNARAQRVRIDYANHVTTTYRYDDKTFRLVRLRTRRRQRDGDGWTTKVLENPASIQDLHYTYDPAGNITRTADDALRTVFHNNHKVDSVCQYTYDPLYRLIEATGRENIGQSAFDFKPPRGDYRDYPYVGAAHLDDLEALRNYTEHYEYDSVGNFLRMIHRAEDGDWTRHYIYDESSLIEPGRESNRLTGTHLRSSGHPLAEPYLYDANGNITQMPHLPGMQWDFMDRLVASSRQVVKDGTPETTFYVYDAAGQRARKITERQNGTRKNERLYVGGYEVYREFEASDMRLILERETLHVMDDRQRIALVETLTWERQHPTLTVEPLQRYQLANHLGSACLELDETAAIVSYEEYVPYGSTSFQTGTNQAEVSLKRYRYTGKERDTETGFSYHGARYYAPWLGRWTSCDPAGLVDGTGVYSYARDNPVRLVDPAGTDGNDPPVATPAPSPVLPEATPPPVSPVNTFGITPTGTWSMFGVTSGSVTFAGHNSAGGAVQAGVVVGLTDKSQLQVQAGPLEAVQASQPDTSGTQVNAQLQLNNTADPQLVSKGWVFAGSLAYANSGGTDASSGGLSATWLREEILHAPTVEGQPDQTDVQHPDRLWDFNAGGGLSKGTGALTPGSTFGYLGTLTLGVSETVTKKYYDDALREDLSPGPSTAPKLGVGFDAYASAGGGNYASPSPGDAKWGLTGTVGADLFGSFTSRRLDAAAGPGNTRSTVGLAIGAFVTVDNSGPHGGVAEGWGFRGVLSVSFGSGAKPPERPKP
jgi:RHS repeat-associated protein